MDLKKSRMATSLIFLVCGLAVSCWAPLVPIAKARLNLDEADLGLVLLAFGVGALLSMPLTGWLVHRRGSGSVIKMMIFFFVGLLPALVIAPTSFLLSVFLFFFGVLGGGLNVAVNSHAVAVEVKQGRPLMSGFHCYYSLGGLLGASSLSALLEWGLEPLESINLLVGVMALIIFTQMNRLLPACDDNKTASEKPRMRFAKRKIFVIGLFCFIFFLAEGAVLDWSAVFLRSSRNYEVALAGMGYAAFSVAMTVGRFSGNWFIRRFGAEAVMRWGSFMAAAGMALAVNVPHLELCGFLLVGVGASNVVPILFSKAGSLPDVSPGVALTAVTTVGYTGMLLGPAFIGFLAQATSLALALSSVALLCTVVGFGSRALSRLNLSVAR